MNGLEAKKIYIIRPNFLKIMKITLKLALFSCIFIFESPFFFSWKKNELIFYQFIGFRDLLYHFAFV